MKNVLFSSLMAAAAILPVAVQATSVQDHPTLRTLGGATAPTKLDAHTTALIVIDFQNEYFSGKLPIPDGRKALEQSRKLVDFADRNGIAVIHVQHINPAASPVFAEGSKGAQIVDEMRPGKQHTVLQKNTVSVFASTDLDARLKHAGIKTIIVAGLMTHACIAAAAREAAPLGYEVVVASDAVATRSIVAWDNKDVVPHDVLNRSALTEISDAFGSVMPTGAILALTVGE
jgi:nicotinamidase-related amidase